MDTHTSKGERSLPDTQACLKRVRAWRWPEGIACPRCTSMDCIRKGTTRKEAQRYQCHDCSHVFNDLTGTVFAGHQLSVAEMFYILARHGEEQASQVSHSIDRTYKSVLQFIHDLDAQKRSARADLPSPPRQTV